MKYGSKAFIRNLFQARSRDRGSMGRHRTARRGGVARQDLGALAEYRIPGPSFAGVLVAGAAVASASDQAFHRAHRPRPAHKGR
jgi:hypothetical protein